MEGAGDGLSGEGSKMTCSVTSLLFSSLGQSLVMWLLLDARKAGECGLYLNLKVRVLLL